MPGISLHCDHPELRAEIGEWLVGAPDVTAADVELFVAVGDVPAVEPDSRLVFKQGRVAIRGGTTASPTLTLDWGPGLGRAVIEPRSRTAYAIVDANALNKGHELYRSFLLNVCILLLRRTGLHHIHGAALVDPTSRGWMFVGESGSGKSTTTALLAQRGWHVGTDDIAFLTRASDNGVDILAWRDHVAVRGDAAEALAVAGGVSFASRKKTGFMPESLGTSWVSCVRPSVLAFTQLDADNPTSMTRLDPRATLQRLMHNSAWVMLDAEVAHEHLALLTALAQQAQAYELRLGRDMFEHPERLVGFAA